MDILSTTHPTILKFFNENSHIDFETVNLLFVQLLENILNRNNVIEQSNAEKIFASINNLCGHFDNFKSQQELKEQSLQDQLTIQISNMKKDHIDELTKIIENKSELTKHELKSNIVNVCENQNEQIQTNIKLMLHEQFPKNNEIVNSLQPMFEKFQENNKELILSIDNSNNKNDLQTFMERMNLNYSNLMSTYQTNVLSKIDNIQNATSSFQDFMNKYQNSSLKGKFGENKLSSLLNDFFTTGEIINTSTVKHSCDYLLKRENMHDIYFENKDYDRNIPPQEIKKFIRDIEEQDSHGIFISQNSGITSKSDFHIDIHKNNILIYLHNVNFDINKIKTAVDIIDHLSNRLNKISSENENIENVITNDELEMINKEYLNFINNKDNLIQLTKDYHKKLNNQINELELPSIEKYLNSKFANVQSCEFLCDICGKYKANSNKALAAHKRGCKKKMENIISIDTQI